MEKKKNYPAVLVANDAAQDVFSDYLISKGYPVTRRSILTVLQSSDLSQWSFVLVVNGDEGDVSKVLKCLDSDLRQVLASCSGGKKDFQPCLSIWHGPYDRDFINYRDWSGFEDGLFKRRPRQKKLLEFVAVTPDGLAYKPADYRVEDEAVGKDFASEIKIMSHLSRGYIMYLQKWLKRVHGLSFEVRFDLAPKKMFKILSLEQGLREFEGLPIFKEGDRIAFYGAFKPITASVKAAEEEQIIIVFDEKLSGQEINRVTAYSAMPAMNAKMMRAYLDYLNYYRQSDQRQTNHVPLDLIKGVGTNNHDLMNADSDPDSSRMILLDNKTDKILRDHSQVEALLDIMSGKYFSLIQGPAGTGKTFVCAVAAKQYFLRGRGILLLSHSNKGVDNLLEEVAKHIPNEHLLRIGNDVNVMSPKAAKLNDFDHQSKFAEILRDSDKPIVVAATLNSLMSNEGDYSLADRVQVVFIDEATRSLLYEVLPAIGKASEKVVLIGDEKQLGNIKLPPTISQALTDSLVTYGFSDLDSERAVADFNDGLFRLAKRFLPSRSLRCNRRSLPNICELVSDAFYEGGLEVGRFNPYRGGEMSLYDTGGRFPEQRHKTSYCNPLEANYLIKNFLSVASAHIKTGGKITDLAIIAPYLAQIGLIKKRLRKHLLFNRIIKSQVGEDNIDEVINDLVVTVDAMQGSERKIIFLSLTRSNAEGLIGFNRDIRRLNVALSRPQEKLVIIGDVSTFLSCDEESIVAAFKRIVAVIKAKGNYQIV